MHARIAHARAQAACGRHAHNDLRAATATLAAAGRAMAVTGAQPEEPGAAAWRWLAERREPMGEREGERVGEQTEQATLRTAIVTAMASPTHSINRKEWTDTHWKRKASETGTRATAALRHVAPLKVGRAFAGARGLPIGTLGALIARAGGSLRGGSGGGCGTRRSGWWAAPGPDRGGTEGHGTDNTRTGGSLCGGSRGRPSSGRSQDWA